MTEINRIQTPVETFAASEKAKSPAKNKEEKVPASSDEFVKSKPGMMDKIKNFVSGNITGTQKAGPEGGDDSDFTVKAAIGGGLIGAGIGTFVGLKSAEVEKVNSQAATLKWQEPDLVSKDLGKIPRDYYAPNSWWFGYGWGDHVEFDSHGQVANGDSVIRDAPVLKADGAPQMHDVEKTITSQRYGAAGAALGLAAIFGIAGAIGGVAVGCIAKLLRK
ncbi:MAG: hypothetical protein V2A78_10185 [bacterium]